MEYVLLESLQFFILICLVVDTIGLIALNHDIIPDIK